ncbi:MAG TPA: sporulation protein [candidate division Zixibacteria bacterium]|nr:sporulation protein [candidate division Zixibacteria bacterium]
MMANNVSEILRSVVGELKEISKSETIIGDPITVGDRTVIPIVKISFGFGAGGGQGEKEKAGTGFGGGGGGGVKIEPSAFIIMDKDGVSILPANKGKWDSIIDSIPGFAKKLSNLKGKMKTSEKSSSKSEKTDTEPEKTDTKPEE